MASGSTKKSTVNSATDVESYLEEEIINFAEDQLEYWKKKSNEFPTLNAIV